jgi:hypothetical protein
MLPAVLYPDTNTFWEGAIVAAHATERQIPLILIGVGFAAYGVSALMHAGSAGVVPVLIAVLVAGSVQTVLLIAAAFLVAKFLSVSFGDFQSAAMKFSGAVLASGGLGAILPVGGIVASIVFLGLILWLFELEVPYAIALTVVYFLLAIVVGIMLRSAMA